MHAPKKSKRNLVNKFRKDSRSPVVIFFMSDFTESNVTFEPFMLIPCFGVIDGFLCHLEWIVMMIFPGLPASTWGVHQATPHVHLNH